MDLNGLESALRASGAEVRGAMGVWEASFDGIQMTIVTDPTNDRMRIVATITDTEGLTVRQRERLLDANFTTALDPRYATHNGIVYAAFMHPLGTLTHDDLAAAMQQVASMVQTFGTTYTGGTLSFVGASAPATPEEPDGIDGGDTLH